MSRPPSQHLGWDGVCRFSLRELWECHLVILSDCFPVWGNHIPGQQSGNATAKCLLVPLTGLSLAGCTSCIHSSRAGIGDPVSAPQTCLVLPEQRHLLLQADVLLLQLRVVLQQAGLPELVFLDVIPQAAALHLHILVDLPGEERGG